jgi:cysteinyl-tRNA synthetase
MCSNIFGDSLDIHSGGIDLKFPHHDNEIAQTEAYYDNHQWINYFLHTGHLNINGLKMSKSLKNFKKISEFINNYNANTFRIYFVNTKWDSVMDFTEDGLNEAWTNEKYLADLFRNVKVWLRENNLKKDLKYDEIDNNFLKFITDKKKIIHDALCDNFNTPLAFKNLLELVSRTYEYELKTRNTTLKLHMIYLVAQYVSFISKCLGLVYKTEFIDYFIYETEGKTEESTISPFVEIISKFRDTVKAAGVEKDHVKVLKACDELRDDILPHLGVKLEDRGKGNPSVWKIYDKEELLKEIQREKEKQEHDRKVKEEKEKEKELKVLITNIAIYPC